MERRIIKKIDAYNSDFKEKIKQKVDELELTQEPSICQLLQYIYDFERLGLNKEDFMNNFFLLRLKIFQGYL